MSDGTLTEEGQGEYNSDDLSRQKSKTARSGQSDAMVIINGGGLPGKLQDGGCSCGYPCRGGDNLDGMIG